MRDNNQKIKLLKLYEMLNRETDCENPLCTQELCARLIEQGISCDRRTLSRDIQLLNECGYEVLETRVSHEKGYYVADRTFGNEELQILIDAVRAANFITEKKTEQMVSKIANLGGSAGKKLRKRTNIDFVTCKHSNEQILYVIDALREAIFSRRKASFFYFDLDENRQRAYRKGKERYIVEPLGLVYNEDNYYLIAYNTDRSIDNDIRVYRLDRMESALVESNPISPEAAELRNGVSRHRAAIFKMFSGKESDVLIEFSNERLMGAIYDKFGEGVKIRRYNGDRYRVMLKVTLSPTFYGWLFNFGTQMRIISPETVIRDYTQYCSELISMYDQHI